MTNKNIISINGRSYDALTGAPIGAHSAQPAPSHHTPKSHPPHKAFSDVSAPALHKRLQKSQTLYRAGLKKPQPLRDLQPEPVKVEADFVKPQHHRSPAISKFGPTHKPHVQTHHLAKPAEPKKEEPIQPARVHPVVTKVLANKAEPAQPQSSRELKEALIRERLAEAQPNTETPRAHRTGRQPRLATILTSSLALLVLAGYLTYINLPNISMRVAATRAGVAANYPNYQPDGYHFAGPISYQPGQVNIDFKSNTNNTSFRIQQQASTWDSQAVLDNYVIKKTGTYLTYQERGLTIYSFGNHAAWVNGGILYTIDGDAPLSSDQLLHIATSM